MEQFILLLRNEKADFSAFAADDYQKLVRHFETWNAELARRGSLVGSANLEDGSGQTLRKKAEKIVVDGPYCETKEAVAGFFLIRASDYDAAVELAKGCPFLPIGGSVEVRRVPHLELEPPETGG